MQMYAHSQSHAAMLCQYPVWAVSTIVKFVMRFNSDKSSVKLFWLWHFLWGYFYFVNALTMRTDPLYNVVYIAHN